MSENNVSIEGVPESTSYYASSDSVPRIAFERAVASYEMIIKRLLLVIMILVAVIGYGLYEFMQFDYTDVTVDSQDGGNANYIGASGVINNGESAGTEAD